MPWLPARASTISNTATMWPTPPVAGCGDFSGSRRWCALICRCFLVIRCVRTYRKTWPGGDRDDWLYVRTQWFAPFSCGIHLHRTVQLADALGYDIVWQRRSKPWPLSHRRNSRFWDGLAGRIRRIVPARGRQHWSKTDGFKAAVHTGFFGLRAHG